MSERYLITAARYVELNPVRAKIAENAWKYRWSSEPAHIKGCDDELVKVQPLLELIDDWQAFLCEGVEKKEVDRLHLHERTGRPLGDLDFISKIEDMLCRVLRKQKPGPKRTAVWS